MNRIGPHNKDVRDVIIDYLLGVALIEDLAKVLEFVIEKVLHTKNICYP